MALIKTVPPEVEKALSKAKVRLMLKKDCAFFATLILQTPMHWVTEDEVSTAATDGIRIFINPDFFMQQDPDEKIFLLLHEIMHGVYEHPARMNTRNHEDWNAACDYVINDELIQRQFKMPKGGLHNIDYRGMNADQIYALIAQDRDNGQPTPQSPWPDIQPAPQGNGGGSAPQKGIGGTDLPTAEQIQNHAKNMLTQAVQASQMANESAGSVPGSVERLLNDMLNPKLPWTKMISKLLFTITKDDYSWKRPNRRYLAQNIYLPSLHSEGIGKIDFAIDTSGSVSEDDFNTFISEIAYVFKRFNPKEIGIMQFDSILQSNDKVCSLAEFKKLKFQGGGGTNVRPILEEYAKDAAKVLIVLTDGYFNHSEELDPKKPVIWAIYNNPTFVPAFGTAVHFSKD